MGSSFRTHQAVNANRADGGVAGHVFANPGTYHVSLTVRDIQGHSAVKTTTILVSDPEVIFSPEHGGHTWCVSTDGDFTGCPTSDPAYHFTDYTQALANPTLCVGNRSHELPLGPRRLLLKRGQTFVGGNPSPGCLAYTNGLYDDFPIMIAPFGQGADPIIKAPTAGQVDNYTWMFGFYAGPSAGTTVTGLNFQGLYNPVTGLGEQVAGCLVLWDTGLRNATIYRNSFSACVINMDFRSSDPSYAVIADNVSTNWQNFGLYGALPYSAILGNTIEQSPDTLSVNWDGKGAGCRLSGVCVTDFPDHGAVRIGQSDHAVLSYNDFTSRNGWGGLGSQPSLRFGSEGLKDLRNAVVSHNRLSPGAGSGGDSNGTETLAGSVSDLVWDGNLVILQKGDYYSGCLATLFGGTTFRNNICLKLPTNTEFPLFGASGALRAMFEISNPGPLNEQTIALPNRFYNNTLISLDEKPGFQPVYDEAFIAVSPGRVPSATPFNFDIKNNLVKGTQLSNFFSYWFFQGGTALGLSPLQVTSERNYFSVNQFRTTPDRYFNYPWTAWGPTEQGSNTTTDPMIAGMPVVCRPALEKQFDIIGATISGDGVRSYITQSGANFGGKKVLRNSRIIFNGCVEGATRIVGGQYCNSKTCNGDPATGPANFDSLYGLNVYESMGDVITLAHDIRTDHSQTSTVSLRASYSPSTGSKIYVFDNSVFKVGDTITYDLESTPRSVTAVGADTEGQYVSITPALPHRATTFICKWAPGQTPGLNFHLGQNSPARESGYAVPVFSDYTGSPRPSGEGWDIGAFEDQ